MSNVRTVRRWQISKGDDIKRYAQDGITTSTIAAMANPHTVFVYPPNFELLLFSYGIDRRHSRLKHHSERNSASREVSGLLATYRTTM